MGRNTKFVMFTLAAAGTVALAACGSDSGSDSKQASADLKAAVTNAKAAKLYHVVAAVSDKGKPLKLDLHYGSNGVDGSVTTQGTTFKIKVVGTALFFNAPASFWKAQGGSQGDTIAAMYGDKWVKSSTTSEIGKGFAEYGNGQKFISQFTSGFTGKDAEGGKKVGTSTVDGTPTTTYGDDTGEVTVDISSSGKKYPLKIVSNSTKKSDDAGTVTLTDWDQSFTVAAPSSSVPLPT